MAEKAFPALTLGNILKDIGNEVIQQTEAGAHELAAALFNGSGFVMYPRAGQEDTQQAMEAPVVEAPQHEQSGGREM